MAEHQYRIHPIVVGTKIFDKMEVIPPGTPVNVYEAYDIMLEVRDMADILIPLHEPRFAGVDSIPA